MSRASRRSGRVIQRKAMTPASRPTTATVVITGKDDRDSSRTSFFQKLAMRLREFG